EAVGDPEDGILLRLDGDDRDAVPLAHLPDLPSGRPLAGARIAEAADHDPAHGRRTAASQRRGVGIAQVDAVRGASARDQREQREERRRTRAHHHTMHDDDPFTGSVPGAAARTTTERLLAALELLEQTDARQPELTRGLA